MWIYEVVEGLVSEAATSYEKQNSELSVMRSKRLNTYKVLST